MVIRNPQFLYVAKVGLPPLPPITGGGIGGTIEFPKLSAKAVSGCTRDNITASVYTRNRLIDTIITQSYCFFPSKRGKHTIHGFIEYTVRCTVVVYISL